MLCDSPFYVLPKAALEKVPVPCGRCPPCKLRRVNSWVFRLLQEEKISSSSHFVTLTYDTRYVPISPNGFMTLEKGEFPRFMKRLRKLTSNTLKYYAVGEYGTINRRPHYHAIVFNCPDPKHFETAWSLGDIHVGNVSGDSIAYTMKYIDKMSTKKEHGRDDRVPEFPLMSKGLGENYLSDQMVKYHKADLSRLYATKLGGHKIALPRYYRQKIYNDDEQTQQMFLAQRAADEKQKIEVDEFNQLYSDSPKIAFEDWLANKKHQRYKSFYKNQIPRTL